MSTKLMRKVVPVRQLGGIDPASPWWHYGVNTRLGSLIIGAGILPPARMVVAEQQALTVFLGYGGSLQFRQVPEHWSCPADGCLILSGEAYSCESTLLSALAFQLTPERLLHTAMMMAGLRNMPSTWKHTILHSHAWSLSGDASEAALQAMLRQEMTIADQLADCSQALVDRLQLDDQIYRLMAALLLPELRLESPLDRLTQKAKQGRDAFDELIDFIKGNLSMPLNLTMLESQSHYSRRSLQYAFQERLGCTPIQWIRKQRLDLARQHLQNPAPGDTVASIATLYGYRSLSLFSVDFQQRFHVKPSQLLRESRSSLPLATR